MRAVTKSWDKTNSPKNGAHGPMERLTWVLAAQVPGQNPPAPTLPEDSQTWLFKLLLLGPLPDIL